MGNNIRALVILVLRIGLGIVFIYAAVGKILDPSAFATDIDNYRMLPYFWVSLMAVILPWLELLCGLFLIIGWWLPGAALLIMLMNLVFIVAITSAMMRGLDISCGCFALSEKANKVGLLRIFEDVIFFIAASYVYIHSLEKK